MLDLDGLPVPLLGAGLGDLEAPVNGAQPREGGVLEVWPVVVVGNLNWG